MLCLIPFDIMSMDSTVVDAYSTTDVRIEKTCGLVQNMIEVCRGFSSDAGTTRDAAAICLSTLLTRPDMENTVLKDFVTWASTTFSEWVGKGEQAAAELSSKYFELVGILTCVAQIFKIGHRNKILPFAISILELALKLGEQHNQVKIRKLITKLIQRIGLTFLPPRIASWRYQRGHRSLLKNLQINIESKHNVVQEFDSNDSKDDSMDAVPPELDDIIEFLLLHLNDKDTVVRWSAAKGIGRLTMRLSKTLADDIVGAVIEVFNDNESENAWHGGCLALAELSRRGLLLPERLERVVPIIVEGIRFDILRGHHSVGAHVRDSGKIF